MDPQRKQQRANKRRQAILATAGSIVASEGLDALTVATLAEALEITPGALYRYFPSKEHILAGVETASIAEVARVLAAAVTANSSRPAIEQLVAVIDVYLQLEVHGSPHFAVLCRFLSPAEAVLPDDVAADVMGPAMEVLRNLAAVLDAAAASESLADGDAFERALILWSAMHGVLERRKLVRLAKGQFDVAQLYRATCETLLVGWGGDRGELDSIWRYKLPHIRRGTTTEIEAGT